MSSPQHKPDHQPPDQHKKVARRGPAKVAATEFYDLQALKRHKASSDTHADSSSSSSQQRAAPQQPLNPLHAPTGRFRTQAAAFEYLDKQACASILRTFAWETAATGQREFIVTSAEVFWQDYIQLPLAQRHHYEIIRQSQPCHLYLDLEFSPECNPGLNGPRLVELLVAGVREQLHELFGIPKEAPCVLELDSSTPSKFSRHLIVRLPGLAFADACHAGRFVRLVLLRLLAKGAHCSQHAQLLVVANNSRDGGAGGGGGGGGLLPPLTSFVDMGVYTRNRAFRLYLSSKFGKSAVLRLTHRFGGSTRCPKTSFHDCLVSVLPLPHHHASNNTSNAAAAETAFAAAAASVVVSSSSRRELRRRGGRVLSLLRVEHDDGQQELLSLPASWQALPMLQLRPLPHPPPPGQLAAAAGGGIGGVVGGGSMQQHMQQLSTWPPEQLLHKKTPQARWAAGEGCGGLFSNGLQRQQQPCFGSSPFPLLDAFISSVCSVGGVQGEVRSWMLLQPQAGGAFASGTTGTGTPCSGGGGGGGSGSGSVGSAMVVYNIKGNRWCGNVGRQHKSNGIYLCVDLAAGTWHQRCYDPECRQFRSAHMPLPAHVWHAYRGVLGPPPPAAPRKQQQHHPHQQHQLQQAAAGEATTKRLADADAAGGGGAAAAAPCKIAAAAASRQEVDDEDEECLQLLMQVEGLQGQQQQQQVDCVGPEGETAWQQGGDSSEGGGVVGGGNHNDDDDDAWCVQVLQEVEQQRMSCRQRQHAGVTAL